MALGLGMQATSLLTEGFLGSKQKKAEKALAKYNQQLALQRAKAVEERTKFRQMRQAEYGQRLLGQQKASLGGSGMASGAGGVGDMILAEQASELELENLLIGQEGLLEASQARSQANQYGFQASQLGQQARNSILGGFLGASPMVATGAYYGFKGLGKFGGSMVSDLGHIFGASKNKAEFIKPIKEMFTA